MFFYLRTENGMTREEIDHLIEQSEKQGLLDSNEKGLIEGYLNFQEAQVQEIMWPREDILFYDLAEPMSKLIYLFVDQKCTRVPICEGSIDFVVGIMSANDFFFQQPTLYANVPHDLLSIASKPFYIPETTLAKGLFRRMGELQQEQL